MKLYKSIVLLATLAVFSAGSAAHAASCGPNAPGWTCNTKVALSGNTTTCTATATSPGGTFNIHMFGGGPGGQALHTAAGVYYGSSTPKDCTSNTCTIKFTYTGSARPTLCNWLFNFS